MGARGLQHHPALCRWKPAPEVEGAEGDADRAGRADARHACMFAHGAAVAAALPAHGVVAAMFALVVLLVAAVLVLVLTLVIF